MKYLTALFFGLVFFLLLSFLLTPSLSDIYMSYYNLGRGPDFESELIKFFIYVQSPIFFIIGFICGYFVHVKYLNKIKKE